MANWALPSLVSNYTNFLTEVASRDTSCATWFDSATNTDTNLTVGTVRWNSTNNNWEKWSGTVWVALTATYGISITGYATSLVGGNNTTLLGAIPYQSNVNTSTLLSPNVSTIKQFLTQTGTGTNGAPPVWGTIGVADITGAAPIASPAFTGAPILPTGTIAVTQTVGNNTTAIATTAFVLANGTSLSNSMPMIDSGTGVIGVATTAAHGDHQHPIDTSRAAVAQTMYIGTTAVAINRASAGISLTGVSIDGNCAGSSGSCTGNAATATNATTAGSVAPVVVIAGSNPFGSASGSTAVTTNTEVGNVRIMQAGTYRLTLKVKSSVTAYIVYGSLYINGTLYAGPYATSSSAFVTMGTWDVYLAAFSTIQAFGYIINVGSCATMIEISIGNVSPVMAPLYIPVGTR